MSCLPETLLQTPPLIPTANRRRQDAGKACRQNGLPHLFGSHPFPPLAPQRLFLALIPLLELLLCLGCLSSSPHHHPSTPTCDHLIQLSRLSSGGIPSFPGLCMFPQASLLHSPDLNPPSSCPLSPRQTPPRAQETFVDTDWVTGLLPKGRSMGNTQ